MKPPKYLIVPLLALFFTAGTPAESLQNIYPDPDQATADVALALQVARTSHKRIIVDFGGNWCPDCHVLDGYFHDSTNKPLLDAGFLLVHVNIGRRDQNLDIAERYQIPLRKGVPALAVLDTDGTLLYSQKAGEFEAMRGMESEAVTAFLTQWKSAGPTQPIK